MRSVFFTNEFGLIEDYFDDDACTENTADMEIKNGEFEKVVYFKSDVAVSIVNMIDYLLAEDLTQIPIEPAVEWRIEVD